MAGLGRRPRYVVLLSGLRELTLACPWNDLPIRRRACAIGEHRTAACDVAEVEADAAAVGTAILRSLCH
jgi:hypothetical protein